MCTYRDCNDMFSTYFVKNVTQNKITIKIQRLPVIADQNNAQEAYVCHITS